MGTGSSMLRSHDEDDVLGIEYEGNSHGVIKRIPIEVKPRGKLGLRSVGSFGRKPKGGSLQSALSMDLENPEVERIKREFEMYRMQKDNEIASMEKKELKLETENKRMRSELQALQKTCTKLRAERDSAAEAERQALARAQTFENERDKVQRQFKIFRETKESEIQNLLKARRDLENKLSKSNLVVEDMESGNKAGLLDHLGASNPGDWWTALESEPSLGSTTQLHQPVFRGPEFAHSQLETEGPFTNVTKEDWLHAAASLAQLSTGVTEVVSNTIRLYISAPGDVLKELDIMERVYLPQLQQLCEMEGRYLVTIHMPYNENDCLSDHTWERLSSACGRQVQQSTIFLALLGDSVNRFTGIEFRLGHLDSPGSKPALFAFKKHTGTPRNSDARELKSKVFESGSCKIIDGYSTPEQGMQQIHKELERMFKIELGVDIRKEADHDSGYSDDEGTEHLCGGYIWDPQGDFEQIEAFDYAVCSSCELGFEKYYERLNAHISAAGPLPPLLISGPDGSGKSLLMAKWIQLQQQKSMGALVLYHFVGQTSSCSADSSVMIRRLTAQLMQHVASPPALTGDPIRLVEEFPRWLEKISSKTPGGLLLILDSIERCQHTEKNLKWLLDPLPVDARVIVSANSEKCPQAWRSWPTIHLDPLSSKCVKELIQTELSSNGLTLESDQESLILNNCRTTDMCNPLYVMVLSSDICRCSNSELNRRLSNLLGCSDCVSLVKMVLDTIRQENETAETRGYVKKILQFIYIARNGISENEVFGLLPNVTWNFLGPLIYALVDRHIVTFRSGLMVLAHQQARQAVYEKYFSGNDTKAMESTRIAFISYLLEFLQPGKVTCRVSDELPWHINQLENKEKLHECILVLCIFLRLYGRGRFAELIGYWNFVGADKVTMAEEYFEATKKLEEMCGDCNGMVTLPRIADMCEALGRFLRDIGLLDQAVHPLQHALELRETALDPDHPKVAQSLHQLAGLHAQWGKYSTAEALYKQALEIYESALGSDHILVAKELDALAILYQRQEKHELADPLHKRSVAIRKKAKPSKSSPTILQSRGTNILQRRALHLEELALGPDSPDLARTLNELGVLYYLQNNHETAESFFRRSLEIRERLLGADHPDLAQSLNNLAALYNDKRNYEKAAPLYERALNIRLKHLSCDHPSVASIVKHLSMLRKKQGELDKAEPLYEMSVEIREKSFGKHHPSVATALVNLAVLYCQQNKHLSALPLYERALKIYEDSFGPSHPRVAETLRNLAVLRYDQGDYQIAAKLYKRATEIKEDEPPGLRKVSSQQSSSGDTSSTVKNALNQANQYFDNS